MKKNSRRALAVVLAVMLALILTPVTAHAAPSVHQVSSVSALYTLLDGSSLADGDTIQLTADINLSGNNYASQFDGKNVTFDLNGHTLSIGGIEIDNEGSISVVNTSPGAVGVMTVYSYLNMLGGSVIATSGGGVQLNANCEVAASGKGSTSGTGSSVSIYSVSCDTYSPYAVTASDGGQITVNGNVTVNTSYSGPYGASVEGSESRVTVNGDITVNSSYSGARGVYTNNAGSGSGVTVNGNVTASGSNSEGVLVQNSTGTTVTVTGDVAAVNMGLDINSGSNNEITVGGSVSVSSGWKGASTAFGSGHSITIDGNITVNGSNAYGAMASSTNSEITVGGSVDINGDGGYGTYATNGSTVTVGNDVDASGAAANSYGAYAVGTGSKVAVGGDVTATGTGAYASSSGTVEVDGDISARGSSSSASGANIYNYGASNSTSSIKVGGSVYVSTTSGGSKYGVYITNYNSTNSTTSVTVGGIISLTGSGGSATGLQIDGGTSSTVSVVAGDVTATGSDNVTGINAYGSSWAVTVSGISTSGGSSNTGIAASGSGTASVDFITATNYIKTYNSQSRSYNLGDGTLNDNCYEYISDGTTIRVKAWELTVAVDPAEGGDAGIGGTSVTSGRFEAGRQVGLIADDATGYDFVTWSAIGGGSFDDDTNASAVFTMPAANVTVTAEFEQADIYSVNISPGIIGGSITAVPTTAEAGDIITLTVTPDSSHIYGEDSLKYNDGTDHFLTVAGISAPFTSSFTMPGSDVTVSAIFEEITAPAITTETLPNGMETISYSQTLEYNSNAPAEWIITSGDWPAGLTLSAIGTISGTPDEGADGSYTFTVRASNGGGSDTQEFTLVILPAEPVITTTSLPVATEGAFYVYQLEATCADPNYYWSVTGGSLPDGLGLQWWDGQIVGTPTVEIEEDTVYPVTISAISLGYGTDEKGFSLTVHPAPENALTLQADGHGSIIAGTSGDYEEGAQISIGATAEAGYVFSEWTSSDGGSFDDETSTSAIFTMPENATTVTAIFVPGYEVNIPEMTGGSITASPAIVAEDAEVDLTITPDPGYVYTEDSLKYNDGEDHFLEVTGGTASFTMPGSNVTVSAIFEEKPAIEVYDEFDLSYALNELEDSDTIKLMDDITYTDPIYISGINVTIDTNGHTLNVEVPGYTALTVEDGGSFQVIGTGSLNLIGYSGIAVQDGGTAEIIGDVTADGGTAVYAYSGTVTVNGSISASGSWNYGAYADGAAASIEVTGDITATGDSSYAAYAYDGGIVTVGGSISASGSESYGAYARGEDTSIEITGDITVTDEGFNAVYAGNSAFITVGGSVASPASAAYAYDGATVIVQGNATSANQYSAGAYAFGGIIEIHGNAISTGSPGYGAVASDYPYPNPTTGSAVTIDGTVSADQYINFDGSLKTQADITVPTTKSGYNTYTGGFSTVWVKIQSHAVTVQNDGNGAGSASTASAIAGTEITLSSTPNSGYHFKEWQAITPSGLTISENTFIMPDESVTVRAVFEANAPSVYNITVQNNGYGTANASTTSAIADTEVTLSSMPNSGYHFKEWQAITPSSLTISANKFIMPDESVTVKAVFEADAAPNPDSPGGGTGGSNTPSAPPLRNATVSGGGSVPVTVNTGSGSASLDLGTLAGNLAGGGNTTVNVPSITGVNSFTASLPASSLSGSGQGSLTLNTGLGSLTIPGNMLSGTELSGNVGITIGEGDTSGLPDDVKEVIGDRPIIQLTLAVNGQQRNWDNPGASVAVSIPYTPTSEEREHPESIVVWYIDGNGNAVCIENGHYDPVSGNVTVNVTHFSDYAVVFKPVKFSDVPTGAWYSKAVGFIAARDITTGTGSGNFSPNAKLTRGQFIVMLMKAYELAPDTNLANNFSDAGNTYYTGYLAAARRLGVSGGVGDNLFAPGREITRQEMFTLLYNALKMIGQLPEGSSGKPLTAFADADGIASWAKDAMTLLTETGTVAGSNGKLSPTGKTTRAEMAQVLYNLMSD